MYIVASRMLIYIERINRDVLLKMRNIAIADVVKMRVPHCDSKVQRDSKDKYRSYNVNLA